MTVREEFEAWYGGKIPPRADDCGYLSSRAEYQWAAWQAAYDAGRKAGLEEAAEKAYATIMRHPGPTDAEAAATAAAIRALNSD